MTRASLWITGALVGCLAGCGGSEVELVSVTGTITLNGEPLPNAEVCFTPDPSQKFHESAMDVTGPQGNYKLKTGDAFGIQPGKYTVHVRKPGEASGEASQLHPNDPFMARLSTTSLTLPGRKPKGGPRESDAIDFTLPDREVTSKGAVIDHDFKVDTSSKDEEEVQAKKSARKGRR
ncbi:MAG: carboxypeptidase-like regulatory domain-containing protein [Isosphaeraceae bacterium]